VEALMAWGVGLAAAWLPFVVADPRSLLAASYRIPNVAGSALRVLGASDAMTPIWCRPAQLVLGTAVAYLMWRRQRPAAMILAVIAVRLLLDPATYSYYTAGLVLGTLLVDTNRAKQRWTIPWFTIAAVTMVYVPNYVHVGPLAAESTHGYLRAAYLLTALFGANVVSYHGEITEAPTTGLRSMTRTHASKHTAAPPVASDRNPDRQGAGLRSIVSRSR
jgi:hypothetical protein